MGTRPTRLPRMPETTKALLIEIEKFLAWSGMRPSTFGNYAVKDGKLMARLRSGSTVTLETANKIRNYIAAARDNPRPKKVAA